MSLFAGVEALSSPNDMLVSVDDFFEWAGGVAGTPERARAQTALEIASGLIRARTGRTLTTVTNDVAVLDGPAGRSLNLPEYPVTAISLVSETRSANAAPVTVAATQYAYSWQTGIVDRTDGYCWTGLRGGITITYTHGYDPLPRDLAGVCLSFAKRLYDTPDSAPVVQETLGAYSVQYGAGGSIGLNDWELDVINRYRNVT